MDQDERDFILESARRIEEWENTPRIFADPYGDMTSEEKSKLLVMLQQTIDSLREELKLSRARTEELLRGQAEMTTVLQTLSSSLAKSEAERQKGEAEIGSLRRQLEEALRNISNLREYRNRDNRNQYGKRSQRKSAGGEEPPTHEQDRQDHDGTPGSVDEMAVPETEQETGGNKARSEAQLRSDILRKGPSQRFRIPDHGSRQCC